MSLDQTEQILAENLKEYADVNAIGAYISEVIEEEDDV
jgi:hypothetical protein